MGDDVIITADKAALEAVDLGDCPFCKGKIGHTKDKEGIPDGMIHSLPMCERFMEEDALSFATSVRKALQGVKS